jgi:formylmethanofuran dehydrogenase subunit D
MKKEEKAEPESKVTLEIEESPITGKSGVARINEETLKILHLEEGKSAVVESKSKSVLLTIYADSMIDKNKIKIRKADLKKLKVGKGDDVSLTTPKPLTDVIRSKLGFKSEKNSGEEKEASK